MSGQHGRRWLTRSLAVEGIRRLRIVLHSVNDKRSGIQTGVVFFLAHPMPPE